MASDPNGSPTNWEELVIVMTGNLKEVHSMSVDLLVNKKIMEIHSTYMKTSR